MDQYLHETVSSHAAVVGFFVGYQVVEGKAGQITPCKRGTAELGIDWKKVPGLTRPDDLEERNAKVEEVRVEKERRKAEQEASEPPSVTRSPTTPHSEVDYGGDDYSDDP